VSRVRIQTLVCGLALLCGCASEPAPSETPSAKKRACAESCACCQGAGCGEECAGCGQTSAGDAAGEDCCASEAAIAQAGAAEPDEPEEANEPAAGPAYVTRGPAPLEPAECGVGQPVADVSFTPLGGEQRSLRAWARQAPASVVLFTSLGCPVTKNYAPQLEELTQAWRAKGVQVLAVDPSAVEEAPEIEAWARQQGWTFPVARDPDYDFCEALHARRTADVFLLDRAGVLRYRGPIDDQYGINYRLEAPRVHHLGQAISALLAGEPIEGSALEAPGCKITRLKLD